MHAMDIMRMESGFLHWGHDISPEENQYEAGLNFLVSFKKKVNFIGKDFLLKQKNIKQKKRLVTLSLKKSKPGFPLLLHDEPVYFEGKIVGRTTSANYSFNYKKSIAFAYVDTEANMKNGIIEIEVEKVKYEASYESTPLHDPKNIIMKS